ncbi:hypothetical protein HGM15179_017926 [Zosterops borbonicus]|uniref:Uncharacterized protein n=1 Tax=Zosterops borbonicus TaxID=364589 RepID=A0A8K1FZZ1_9PASS|nr:hypothetical protein HGM15179_017926 [Zosterops borbonicus]
MVAQEELESNQSNVQGENDDGYEAGGVEAKEEVNSDEKREEVDGAGHDEDTEGANEEDDDPNVQSHLESRPEELIQWPVVDLEEGCSMISHLMGKLTSIIGLGLSDSFYLVPGDAIGVGSAFEGWSPRAEDAVYSVLVPESPSRTHLPAGAGHCRDAPEDLPCACGAPVHLQQGASGAGHAVFPPPA